MKKENVFNKKSFKIVFSFLMLNIFIIGNAINSFALSTSDGSREKIKNRQIIELSKNFKNIIEENHRLLEHNQDLKQELERMRLNRRSEKDQFHSLKQDRDLLAKNYEITNETNMDYSRKLQNMQEQFSELKQGYENKIKELEYKLAMNTKRASSSRDLFKVAKVKKQESVTAPFSKVFQLASRTTKQAASHKSFKKIEEKTTDLLSKIEAFTTEDEKLKLDSGRAHYNMGNVYFEKGDYEIAAAEYFQAVNLMPEDPDAHYNLAFVSSHLGDYKTALKHFKMYLYLSPDANDRPFVNGKIIEAKLQLKTEINSILEDEPDIVK